MFLTPRVDPCWHSESNLGDGLAQQLIWRKRKKTKCTSKHEVDLVGSIIDQHVGVPRAGFTLSNYSTPLVHLYRG